MNPAVEDDFGFVSFDDLRKEEDEFGFIPFQPEKKVAQRSDIEFEENPDISPEENILEEPKQEKSFLRDVTEKTIQGTGGQIALGLAQAATSPLDLMKLYLTGEGLSGLEEAQEASERMGIPFDMEKEREKFISAMEYLPTQKLAEEWFTKKTGISTEPQDRFDKAMRGLAEFAGFGKMTAPKKGVQLPKLGKKALGGEEQALRETAEKFGLRKFAGMEAEGTPKVTPIVSANKQSQLTSELGKTSKKAIDDIIGQKVPIKKMKDMGVNLEEAYETAYSAARNTAGKMGKENIDFSNVTKWIDQQIKKTKSSSPSLSKSQQTYINVLKDEKSNLTKKVAPKKEVTLFGPNGEKITTPPKAKRIAKDMNADQALNQYRSFNDNVKGIWRKPEFAGSENAVKNAYAGLNEQLINAIENANPNLADELKFANKVFHETSKLDQVEGILEKSFKDGYNPKKLARTLSNKRDRKFLERSLGENGIKDLERIAKYGQKAEEKVLKQLKNPKTIKEYLSSMTPMQLGLLVGGKATLGSAYYIPKSIAHRVQGLLFTRNGTKKGFIQFLKDGSELGRAPTSQTFIKSAKNLQKAIEEEFGSEEDLLQMASQEE